MRKLAFAFSFFVASTGVAFAQGAAPEMYGVHEIILEQSVIDDTKSATTCGVTSEKIELALDNVFKDSGVPVVIAANARPQSLGVARIQLIPEVYTHVDETLGCVSWVSLSAENRVTAVIAPVKALRSINLLYWQQHTKVATAQTVHQQKVIDMMQKMATQFVQKYRESQPPDQAQ